MSLHAGGAYVDLLPRLSRSFGADVERQVQGPLAKAGDRAGKSFGDRFSASVGKVAKTVAVGVGAASAAALAFGAKSADTFARVGGEVAKLQRFTGLTAEAASRLRFAGLQAGLGVDDLTLSLGQLSKKSVGTSLDDLGLGLKDAAGKALPLNKQLLKIADRFQSMPNGAEKTALAMKIFGKSGAKMIPFLNRGAKGIAELEAQSDKLGNTLSGPDLEAVKESTKQHRLFSAAMDGLQVQVGRFVLPVMTKFTTLFASSMPPAIGFTRTAMERLSAIVSPLFAKLDVGISALKAAFSGEGITSDGFVGFMERVGVAGRLVADVFSAVIPTAIDLTVAAFSTVTSAIGSALGAVEDLVRDALSSMPALVFSDALRSAFSGATQAWSDYASAGVGPIADKLAALDDVIDRVTTVLSEQRDVLIPAAAAAAAFAGAFATYSAVTQAVDAVSAGFQLLGPAIGAALGPLAANPVGIIIALVVALGAALVTAYFKVKPFRDAVDGLIDVVGGFAATAAGFIGDLVDRAMPALESFLDTIVRVGRQIGAGLTTGLRVVKGAIQRHVIAPLRPLGRFLADEVAPVFTSFGELVSAIFARLGEVLGPIVTMLSTQMRFLAGVMSDAVGPAFRIVASVIGSALTIIGTHIQTIARVLAPILATAFDAAAAAIDIVFGYITGVIQFFLETLRGIFTVLTGLVQGDFHKVWEGIVLIVSAPIRAARDIVVNTFEEVIGFLGRVPGRVGDFVGAIFHGAIANATSIFDGVKEVVEETMDSIVTFVSKLPGRLATAARGMWDGIKTAFKSAINYVIRGWNSLKFKLPSFDGKKIAGHTIIPAFEGPTLGVPPIAELRDAGGSTFPGRSYMVGPGLVELFSPGRGHVMPQEQLIEALVGAGGREGLTIEHLEVPTVVDATADEVVDAIGVKLGWKLTTRKDR